MTEAPCLDLQRSDDVNAIAKRLETIEQNAGLRSIDIAQIMQTSQEKISRWKNGHAQPRRQSEIFLLELAYITDILSEFYEPQEARHFFLSPQKLLDGEKPASLMQQGRYEQVLSLVKSVRDTVFL